MPTPADEGTLYAIGVLSKMMGVSTDTLRYYDEIGLCKPAQISQETGYRYYTNRQAATLARILELKHYGFSLNEIKNILNQGEVTLTDVYLNRYWALENEKKKLQEALDALLEKIKPRQEEPALNKKIMIVDDAPFMRSICKDLLTRAGYEVVGEAGDGLEAVALYPDLKPDMVLLDIVMPNCDGIEALRKMKAYDKDVHAVMISAMSQARIIAEALLAGAQDFISKPFQTETLLGKVSESFHPAAPVNYDITRQIYDAFAGETYTLDTSAVERLMQTVRSQAGAAEVAAVIARLKEKSPAEQQGHDPNLEQTAHINARLDKLEQGQAEILSMLRTLKMNNK